MRRAFAQRLPIRDQMLPPHRGVRRLLALADVQASAHLAAQGGRVVDDLGDAPRLIEGQGVHRIDEDGLHAFLPGMAPAVIQNRPQEALRLAGPRAGGHDGGTPAVRRARIEALVRDALMAVRREAERHLRERLAAFGRELRRQRDGEVRAFDEVLLLGEEVVQNVRERRIGGAEAGGEEVPQRTGDLVGDDGGDHGAVVGSAAKCGGAMVA